MVDPQLLRYYNEELIYLRELAGEFAQAHRKVARRLGMHAGEVADPYVERLIESFCFMAARMRLELDAQFPRFTGRLLEVLYPNYVAPTPSMAVACLYPSRTEGNLVEGFRLPRGTALRSRVPDGERTACEFRSGQDVVLYPVEIAEALLTGVPPDIPALARFIPPDRTVRGALRLKLRTTGNARMEHLSGLDRLSVYLTGDEQVASHLFELLHASAVASITATPGEFNWDAASLSVVTKDAIVHDGLGPDESLLPLGMSKFLGHNLLHEYFACPRRFHFFTLTGLEPGIRRARDQEVEIVVLLERSPGWLVNVVDASRFALFCTPVINLFPRRTDPIEMTGDFAEFPVIPSRLAPLDYEVYRVDAIHGQIAATSAQLGFRPLYRAVSEDEGNPGRYFSTRRERPMVVPDDARRYRTRAQYIGTEVFASLVDGNERPYRGDIRYLSVHAMVTNRDLPSLISCDGIRDLAIDDSAPVDSVGLVCPPSAPIPPYAEREIAWKLIRQLNLNYLSIGDPDGQGLRDLLELFLRDDDTLRREQVEGIVGVKTFPVGRRLPGAGPIVFGRGIVCTLTVDESRFSGISPYPLGLILEHYLARHVSIHSFTQTELHSVQRGRVARWPVRGGGRGAV